MPLGCDQKYIFALVQWRGDLAVCSVTLCTSPPLKGVAAKGAHQFVEKRNLFQCPSNGWRHQHSQADYHFNRDNVHGSVSSGSVCINYHAPDEQFSCILGDSNVPTNPPFPSASTPLLIPIGDIHLYLN